MVNRFLQLAAVVCLLGAAAAGQTSAPRADLSALTRETQQVDQHDGKIGMFWWVPADFWEQSALANGMSVSSMRKAFAPLDDYTVMLVGVGDVGVGAVDWMRPADLRPKIKLRDQAGNLYAPVEEISPDAQQLITTLKPVFKNIMGPLADGMNFFLFPAKTANGGVIANPRGTGEFSVVVSDLMGQPASSYTWRLPLTELMPPRICPVGKEKLQASWRYCPWHGNKLEDMAAPAPSGTPVKPQATAH